jgi:exosortase
MSIGPPPPIARRPAGAEASEPMSPGSQPTAVAPALPAHRWVAVGLAGLLGVVLYAPTVGWLFERWTMSVWQNAHGLLIPPMAAYFAWYELRECRGRPSASAWGFAWLTPALLLHAVDAGLHTQLLSALSLVLVLPGVSLIFLGPARTRAIAFPLLFLMFMLPIPLGFIEPLIGWLRGFSATASATLVPLAGIPVFQDGTTLHIANAALEIADACSGFSTLYASLAVALLVAYSSGGTWRRLLVLVAAAPIAIAANLVRVILLILLVYSQGTAVLATRLHEASGLLTFALAIPLIFWLGGPARRPQSLSS